MNDKNKLVVTTENVWGSITLLKEFEVVNNMHDSGNKFDPRLYLCMKPLQLVSYFSLIMIYAYNNIDEIKFNTKLWKIVMISFSSLVRYWSVLVILSILLSMLENDSTCMIQRLSAYHFSFVSGNLLFWKEYLPMLQTLVSD